MGHDAKLTLGTYGHVIDELDDELRVPAEEAIRAARSSSCNWCGAGSGAVMLLIALRTAVFRAVEPRAG
jgi:hypothetical protein